MIIDCIHHHYLTVSDTSTMICKAVDSVNKE